MGCFAGLVCWGERWVELGEWTMRVPGCIVLALILVKKKVDDTCFHIHTAAVSTLNHVWRVMKNGYLTPKQTQENGCKHKKQLFPFAALWDS